jgi:hypothetical protein
LHRFARFIALVALAGAACSESGIALTLVNVGGTSLDSVVVHTTGYDYPLGNLAPGDTARARLQATGESHVELTHGRGSRSRLRVGGYFERGYTGTMHVRLTADSVLTFHQATR